MDVSDDVNHDEWQKASSDTIEDLSFRLKMHVPKALSMLQNLVVRISSMLV